MKKIFIVAIFIAALGGAPAVLAHDGHDHGTSAIAQQELDKQTADRIAEQSRKADIEAAQRKAGENAKTFLGDLRQRAKQQTQEERIAHCEQRKTGLQTKLTSLQKNARSFMTKVTNVYEAAQKYMDSRDFSSETLSTQLIAADAAQADAEVQVSALEQLAVTIDCNSTSVAQQVASFRSAAEKARDSLHMYKQAVKDVLKTLREFKEAA